MRPSLSLLYRSHLIRLPSRTQLPILPLPNCSRPSTLHRTFSTARMVVPQPPKTAAAFGSWPSPITSDFIVASAISFAETAVSAKYLVRGPALATIRAKFPSRKADT